MNATGNSLTTGPTIQNHGNPEPALKVGHINLEKSLNGIGEHFIALVETLDRHNIEQHVIVRNESLARRIAVCRNVTVGPTTASPVIAYCLSPAVDVIHSHDETSAHTALLLMLTRSIPYVVTRRRFALPAGNAILRSVYQRAAGVVCTTDAATRCLLKFDQRIRVNVIADISRRSSADFDRQCNRIAAEHRRLYNRATAASQIPAVLL